MSTSSVVLPWRFDGDPPVPTSACVNIRHRGAGCTRCADSCPVHAIDLGSSGPVVHQADACVRCDACVPACPTEAIEPGGSLRALRRAIADAPRSDEVVICCPRSDEREGATGALRHDRCLAGIGGDELVLLAASGGGRLRLDDTPCQGCQLAGLHAAIAAAAERANRLSRAFGVHASVVLATVDPRRAPVRARPVVDATEATLSRRTLFRTVTGTTVDRTPAGPTSVPPTRRRLLQHVRTAAHGAAGSAAADADVGFGTVLVDADRCSACGLCAQLCPTDALTFAMTGDATAGATFELRAHPDRCVACDLCVSACPEGALAVRRALDPDAVRRGAPVSVLSGPLASCQVCGAATRPAADGETRCFACRPGVVTPLRDERGLMADLLGRSRA